MTFSQEAAKAPASKRLHTNGSTEKKEDVLIDITASKVGPKEPKEEEKIGNGASDQKQTAGGQSLQDLINFRVEDMKTEGDYDR